ncbi:MAG: precorrin-6y C5,15-methyltransferase (decarboxylating) subunit CbiE [Cytophagales bacterium]|nr:precorrin-6y C5,15-methyltransferase (decarboxylating) subunit CbiE [Cytophagales bacterium]
MSLYLFGMLDACPPLSEEQQKLIAQTTYFSGSERHKKWVQYLLPTHAHWIDLNPPLEQVLNEYAQKDKEDIILFVSGDPLFFGIGNLLVNRFPERKIYLFPHISSIQRLCQITQIPSHLVHTISLHGRTMQSLDRVLIKQSTHIGILTDKQHNPSYIAQYLISYGYLNYSMWVGEHLGGKEERLKSCTLQEAAASSFSSLNAVLLIRNQKRPIPFGIPDQELHHLPQRPNMITKMPIRLMTLHALNILEQTCLWDIGFCTGSISMEAKLKNPALRVVGFEKNPVCESLWEKNTQRWGLPGMTSLIGDFIEIDLSQVPKPDAVFIGGHGGKLHDMIPKINTHLSPGGIVVINALKSEDIFLEQAQKQGWKTQKITKIQLPEHQPITILQAQKP